MVVVLMAVWVIQSNAQEAQVPKNESKSEKHKRMTEELNLSSEQSKELKVIHEEFKQNYRATKENQTLSAEEKKKQLRELQKERMKKMNTILTPEQQEKFSQMKKARHSRKHDEKPDSSNR